MAKISVNFDTVDKTIKVSLDGKPVENVQCVRFDASYMEDEDEFNCCITTMTKDETNDMRSYTQLMASEKSPEFVSKEDFTQVRAAIAKFLSKE